MELKIQRMGSGIDQHSIISPPLANISWHSGKGRNRNNNRQKKKKKLESSLIPHIKSGFDLTSSTNEKQINRQETNPLNNFYKCNAWNQEHILLKSPTEQTRLAALPSFQSQSNHFYNTIRISKR